MHQRFKEISSGLDVLNCELCNLIYDGVNLSRSVMVFDPAEFSSGSSGSFFVVLRGASQDHRQCDFLHQQRRLQLCLSRTSNININFSCREGTNAPQLVIETSTGATNTPTPTNTPGPTATPTRTPTIVGTNTPTLPARRKVCNQAARSDWRSGEMGKRDRENSCQVLGVRQWLQ
jgi:hypothetical protein